MVTEEERELLRIQLKQELEKEESSQIAESATETVVSEVDKDITCSDNSNEEFGLPSIIDDPPSIERFELMKILVELEEQWKQEKPKVAPRQVSSPRIHSVPRPTSRLIGSVKSSVPNPSSLQGKGLSAQIKSSTVQSQSHSMLRPNHLAKSNHPPLRINCLRLRIDYLPFNHTCLIRLSKQV